MQGFKNAKEKEEKRRLLAIDIKRVNSMIDRVFVSVVGRLMVLRDS